MDSQNFIEYEISDHVSGELFITDSLVEAMAYYERGWYVVERRITAG
ncbi:MAG: hypothetical protein FWE67_03465 [Planctomycetaceae bacterium]|nr:hypothetical protein [Planctomycetaceae bacterium]